MSYRDDHEALLQRAGALERELEAVKAEAEAHKAEAAQLRAEADAVDDEPRALTVAPPRRVVILDAPSERERYVVGALGVGWTALAFAVGVVWWMVPAAIATVLAAGWLSRRFQVWRAEETPMAALRLRWRDLPIDEAAYTKLMTDLRRSVVVRIDVTFQRPLVRDDRERVMRKLSGIGAIGRDGAALTITSPRLRTKRVRGSGTLAWDFDPSPVRGFCEAAFVGLATVAQSHPIAAIRPYARTGART